VWTYEDQLGIRMDRSDACKCIQNEVPSLVPIEAPHEQNAMRARGFEGPSAAGGDHPGWIGNDTGSWQLEPVVLAYPVEHVCRWCRNRRGSLDGEPLGADASFESSVVRRSKCL